MCRNSERTIFIHIGTEKTGTTSVQSFLTKNATRLQQANVWYPAESAAAYVESNAHFPIAASLLDGQVDFVTPAKAAAKDECLRSFLEDCRARTENNVVISAEHFSSRLLGAGRLEHFRQQLAQLFDRIMIVVYVRSQLALVPSAYSTAVRTGRSSHLDLAEVTPANPYYNMLALLDLWAGVFGRDNMIAREFSPHALAGGDICADFLGLLGVPGALMEECPRENTSLTLAELAALRRVNACLPSFESDPAKWRTAQILRGVYITPFLDSGDLNQPFRLTQSEASQILDRFRDDNEALNERYFSGRLSMDWFFLPQDAGASADGDGFSEAQLEEHCLSAVFPRTIIALATRLRETTVENRQMAYEMRQTQLKLEQMRQSVSENVSFMNDQLQQSRRECEHLTSELRNLEGQLQKIRSTTTWRMRQKLISTKKRIKGKMAVN